MKKYLMTGIAALAMCFGFTSCSHDIEPASQEDLNNLEAQKIVNNYNQAFIKAFGQPAANQEWGFGGYAAGTRVADPRGNMWASEGWNVPPVITDKQKDIVRRYFQQNTPLGYNDPGWSNFWIQQVYKGGTKTTDGSQTTEKYIIGNDDEVTGGDHMDHLCSKSASGVEDHVNDFNNSDNNDWDGRMLMVSSSTNTFGYINSNATAIHYDKAALVNWRVIAQWAVDKGLEESVEKSVLNDGWNRSYMGFDWEQALPDYCYKPILDYSVQWSADLPFGFPVLGYETFEFEGNTYRFLSANSNEYAYDSSEPKYGGKQNYNNKPSDDIIRELLTLGYLPYSDTLKDWIKLSTGSDGYYSDWIVTLTEAKKSTVDPDDVCIIAEDLSASEDTDFDFNDVVFTVHYNTTSSATVTLYAAGGTLPLWVGDASHEVHKEFGYPDPDPKTGLYKMINTGAKANVNNVPVVSFDVTSQKSTRGKDIVIKVDKGKKNDQGVYVPNWIELTATGGAPAAKVCVGVDFATGYKWCYEREDIKTRYNRFSQWVTDDPTMLWWRN